MFNFALKVGLDYTVFPHAMVKVTEIISPSFWWTLDINRITVSAWCCIMHYAAFPRLVDGIFAEVQVFLKRSEWVKKSNNCVLNSAFPTISVSIEQALWAARPKFLVHFEMWESNICILLYVWYFLNKPGTQCRKCWQLSSWGSRIWPFWC